MIFSINYSNDNCIMLIMMVVCVFVLTIGSAL